VQGVRKALLTTETGIYTTDGQINRFYNSVPKSNIPVNAVIDDDHAPYPATVRARTRIV